LRFSTLSILAFISFTSVFLPSSVTASDTKKLGDIEPERKTAQRIFPKGFKNNPMKFLDKELMAKLLISVAHKQALFLKRIIRHNKFWVYQSRDFHNIGQLGLNPEFTLVKTTNPHHPIAHRKWTFNVTVRTDKIGTTLQKPITYRFKLLLLPYNKLMALPLEEKAKISKWVESERKVETARPSSIHEHYVPQIKTMIKAMHEIPLNEKEETDSFPSSAATALADKDSEKGTNAEQDEVYKLARTLSSVKLNTVTSDQKKQAQQGQGSHQNERAFVHRASLWRLANKEGQTVKATSKPSNTDTSNSTNVGQ
jgi:hypothetical protein